MDITVTPINNNNNNNDNNNNCVIGLCVYNNERGLPSVLSNIVELSESKLFDKITIVAFYDSSTDNSYAILESFKNRYRNKVGIKSSSQVVETQVIETVIIMNKSKHVRMSLGHASRVMDKLRTTRIALARNQILNYIRSLQVRQGIYNKYFIMMDSNEYACVGKINVDTLRSALERSDEWDSISFDREAGYYDYWALSFDPHIYSFYHVENQNEIFQSMVTGFAKKLNDAKIKSNITNELNKRNQKNEGKYDYDLIPVHSAFNGFAIYKTSMFLNCSYSSIIHINLFPKHLIRCKIINNFKNDCEHRKFHLEAIKKNGARIMVSPLSIFYKLPVPNPKLRGPA